MIPLQAACWFHPGASFSCGAMRLLGSFIFSYPLWRMARRMVLQTLSTPCFCLIPVDLARRDSSVRHPPMLARLGKDAIGMPCGYRSGRNSDEIADLPCAWTAPALVSQHVHFLLVGYPNSRQVNRKTMSQIINVARVPFRRTFGYNGRDVFEKVCVCGRKARILTTVHHCDHLGTTRSVHVI